MYEIKLTISISYDRLYIENNKYMKEWLYIMDSIEEIKGIGKKTKELFNKLGIYTKNDLIHYYPYRYEILKRTNIEEIYTTNKIIIDGHIISDALLVYLSKNLKRITFKINIGNNILNVIIYNRIYLLNELKTNKEITVIGKYDINKKAIIASDIRFEKLSDTPKIESIYHKTPGLTQKIISKSILNLLEENNNIPDYIPEYLSKKYNFISKKKAIHEVHIPSTILILKKARQRLKYEELFMYLLKINYLKEKITEDEKAISRNINDNEIQNFINNLPFTLTKDQHQSINEIINDLKSKKRMNRLLQGDVGSGKTIVAFVSTYANYLSGYQTALMVPTEILATQHYNEAFELFSKYNITIELLTSSTNKNKKKNILNKLLTGEIDLLIGTQSLIQEDVKFKNLGLVITDEQHRFGVNQRNAFKKKGITPDILSMSATPIPRTYALTIYGDMEISSIKTKPANRKEVITYFKLENEIIDVLTLMKQELDKKHQIYVVAPMIEEDESNVENVNDLENKINRAFSKIAKTASIHGGMSSTEKQNIMKKYESGEINILISTTVIEVGVNVSNASMIVIWDANMFGLSTLHQLRGRVGRSNIQSYCILIAKENCERLKMLEKCNDGFEISEYDFKNRGEGDLFGIRQHGDTGLIISDISKDYEMLLKVKDDIKEFIEIYKTNKEKYNDIYNELTKIDTVD